ncbi:uncharacterized, partial [Tachysurus ichikawai]
MFPQQNTNNNRSGRRQTPNSAAFVFLRSEDGGRRHGLLG